MPLDFSQPDRVLEQRERIAAFVRDEVIPREQDAFRDGVTDELRVRLQGLAHAKGLLAPQVSSDLGGGGFAFTEAAVLLEAAGYSLLGPLALHCSAPDEGNIALLEAVATPGQRADFLEPLARGEVRSCFAMTEPPPGAGSDPRALLTTAHRVAGGWRLDGEKHLITGADGAAFAIVMARAVDERAGEHPDGPTMFLVPSSSPGWFVGEHARTIDSTTLGGHCRVTLDEVFVPDDQVLGGVGEGLVAAQVRLAPARLTHCMRWLGAAQRAHDIALARATTRQVFGAHLSDLGLAQQLIADNEVDLAAARALLWHACWHHAAAPPEHPAVDESSRAKVFVSEAVGRVVDRAVQLCGGLGTSEELVVGRIYTDIRAFRIYDGASEAHRMSIARRAAKRVASPPRVN